MSARAVMCTVMLICMAMAAGPGKSSSEGQGDIFLVVDVVGKSSVNLGQVLEVGSKVRVEPDSRVRLVTGREIIDITGPAETLLSSLVGTEKSIDAPEEPLQREVLALLQEDLFSADRPRAFRDDEDGLPPSASLLNGDGGGVQCVSGDIVEIWTRKHRDAPGLKIVDRETGAAAFVFADTSTPTWPWPEDLEPADGMTVDLFWEDTHQAVPITLRVRAHGDTRPDLEWHVSAGCAEQVLIGLRTLKPHRRM